MSAAFSPNANIWAAPPRPPPLQNNPPAKNKRPIINIWILVLYSYLTYVSLHLYYNTENSRVFTQKTNRAIITLDFLAARLISCLVWFPTEVDRWAHTVQDHTPTGTRQGVPAPRALLGPASTHQTDLVAQTGKWETVMSVLFLFFHSLDLLQLMIFIDYVYIYIYKSHFDRVYLYCGRPSRLCQNTGD